MTGSSWLVSEKRWTVVVGEDTTYICVVVLWIPEINMRLDRKEELRLDVDAYFTRIEPLVDNAAVGGGKARLLN